MFTESEGIRYPIGYSDFEGKYRKVEKGKKGENRGEGAFKRRSGKEMHGGGKKEKEKREPRVTGGNGKTRIKRERKSMGRAGENMDNLMTSN